MPVFALVPLERSILVLISRWTDRQTASLCYTVHRDRDVTRGGPKLALKEHVGGSQLHYPHGVGMRFAELFTEKRFSRLVSERHKN